MALFRNFGVNHAKDVTGRGGIACAAYSSMPPRNAADFLELAKNFSFLDQKLIRALYETADGRYLKEPNDDR
jgi:hypothetical protein